MLDVTRRSFLYGLGSSLGAVAFSDLLAAEVTPAAGPLAVKPPMLPARAKNVILLFMEGWPPPSWLTNCATIGAVRRNRSTTPKRCST